MTNISNYPADVQEILIFMSDGKFLNGIYKNNDKHTEIIKNIHKALEIYTDQDIKIPYYFLPDIFNSALGEIKTPTPPNQLENFAMHRDSKNYYEKIRTNNKHLIIDLNLDDDDYDFLTNIFYEDLVTCAKSRLFSEEKINFFEKLFKIYESSGFPCGWKGRNNPNNGDFVIFSKTDI